MIQKVSEEEVFNCLDVTLWRGLNYIYEELLRRKLIAVEKTPREVTDAEIYLRLEALINKGFVEKRLNKNHRPRARVEFRKTQGKALVTPARELAPGVAEPLHVPA